MSQLPPLWPLVFAGMAAVVILVIWTVTAGVRDWQTPAAPDDHWARDVELERRLQQEQRDERRAAARLTEHRRRLDNVAHTGRRGDAA